ncbi:hypothetical protein [Streptomyces sp. NPDC005374]|uniref:hypothetical protein n=1 Tax=Streptomyces sp. NPDC005374 TaxID=3364713 RepID=UPI0036C6803F
MSRKAVSRSLVVGALSVFLVAGAAFSANAATVYGGNTSQLTNSNSLSLFYNSNQENAEATFGGNVYNYSSPNLYVFAGSQFSDQGDAGYGTPVKNNAASYGNNGVTYSFNVWYNSGYSGPVETIAPGTPYGGGWNPNWGNFNSTLKNENASQTMWN